MVGYQINLLTRDGNRIELGVRTKVYPSPLGTGIYRQEDLEREPQSHYWFEPGETLQMDVAGVGTLPVTGEWMDHMPPAGSFNTRNHDLDPGPDEMRIMSPLLLRGKKVVGDMEGGGTSIGQQGVISIYLPEEGLFELSLSHLEGAVEGRIRSNRISFTSNGHSYEFITGEPVARTEQVWVLHTPNFKPPESFPGGSIISSSSDLNHLLSRILTKN
jgi:hypothetical protein